jgi:hypothetical protein
MRAVSPSCSRTPDLVGIVRDQMKPTAGTEPFTRKILGGGGPARSRNHSGLSLTSRMMRRKLLRRTRRQKGELSRPDLENIETRARSAYRELTA